MRSKASQPLTAQPAASMCSAILAQQKWPAIMKSSIKNWYFRNKVLYTASIVVSSIERMSKEQQLQLWELGFNSIKGLEVEDGILASGRDEVYGCIFGRDSLITSLELLEAYERTRNVYFLELVKKILVNISKLQGTKVEIESGEEPGKMIHEYRPERHEHLTKHPTSPWYVYPDNIMRNYDSVDSTPLFLITLHAYLEASKDTATVE